MEQDDGRILGGQALRVAAPDAGEEPAVAGLDAKVPGVDVGWHGLPRWFGGGGMGRRKSLRATVAKKISIAEFPRSDGANGWHFTNPSL
ncbi:hypothetical protein D9M68_478920 [compost metagenome]